MRPKTLNLTAQGIFEKRKNPWLICSLEPAARGLTLERLQESAKRHTSWRSSKEKPATVKDSNLLKWYINGLISNKTLSYSMVVLYTVLYNNYRKLGICCPKLSLKNIYFVTSRQYRLSSKIIPNPFKIFTMKFLFSRIFYWLPDWPTHSLTQCLQTA